MISVGAMIAKRHGLLGLGLCLALWGCQPIYVKSLFPPTLSYAPTTNDRKAERESKQAGLQPSPAPTTNVVESAPTPSAAPPSEESSAGPSAPSSGGSSSGSSSNAGERVVKQQPPSAGPPGPSSGKDTSKGPVLTLAPGGNPADAARSKQRAQDALKHATQQLTTVDRAKLAGQNAADYDLVAGLIRSAQEALKDEDSVRAQGLAEKAAALAEQLSSRIAPPH